MSKQTIIHDGDDNSIFDDYSASTARIIADKGNVMQADIMEIAERHCETFRQQRDEIRSQYWALHERIQKTAFKPGFSEQVDAVAKLGELALAMRAFDKAYSAMSTVRCFT